MLNNQFSKTIIFYCFNFSMGGTETLILRLMKYYGANNYRIILLTETKINESIAEDSHKVNFEHYIYKSSSKNFYSLNNEILSFQSIENPIVVSQFLPEFLKCSVLLIKSKYGVRFSHVLYIVHPNSTFYNPKVFKVFAKSMIGSMLRKGNLIFMDETCISKCVEFYKITENVSFNICRLPLFINDDKFVNKRNDIFNVLTVTRFEFPFKGYVLGLVNSFAKLHKKYPNTSLTIIGNGKGKMELQELILKLPESTSNNILTIDEVPYHKINDFISKSDVYVGMGTTVLDAANKNKIVVTAVAYQKENFSVGFFHDNYSTIGEVLQKKISYLNFEDLLETVITVNDSEYEIMSLKSKEMLTIHYDIKVVAEKILIGSNKFFSNFEIILINILYFTHKVSVKILQKIKN
ncbi:glycosyltransferase [Flavobacterium sp. S87F.05.LMB.W.Kidney.N]|uniref:glycosyltransferase n=1 Tax=Flavobacterium sp. S87F.05.LMB.W.Kidney.N TaxID=1278758 RepID=UPI0010647318|nr:glycosyltransferase [Flavobacterium sp. S87F.05.LMB.W.Kidney.N]TDX09274.1 glycosyl transferase family 1 [Flavobacterium sp. S87F.05.LMB.W.Kidney.N]